MQDPNLVVPPDYTSHEFEEDCKPLVNVGLTEQQAMDILACQWALKNTRDEEAWTRRQREAAITVAEEEEWQEANHHEQEEETAQILKDKRKKNKAKYVPIPNTPAPSEPIILPSQVAIWNIQQHKFCGL